MPQAKDAFLQFQAAQIRARDEELNTLKSEAAAAATAAKDPKEPADGASATAPTAEAPPKKPGVQPVASPAAERGTGSGAGAGSPLAEFESRVKALTADGRMTRSEAASRVFREDPALRDAVRAA